MTCLPSLPVVGVVVCEVVSGTIFSSPKALSPARQEDWPDSNQCAGPRFANRIHGRRPGCSLVILQACLLPELEGAGWRWQRDPRIIYRAWASCWDHPASLRALLGSNSPL